VVSSCGLMPDGGDRLYGGQMDARLGSGPARPSRFDLVLAAFYTVVVVVEAFTEASVRSPAVHSAVAVTATLALAWRRVHPVSVAVVVAVCFVALAYNGGGLSVAFAVLVVSFTLGSETEGRRSLFGLGLVAVTFVGLMLDGGSSRAGDLAAAVTMIGGPWVAGRTLRRRSWVAAEAIARADRTELERELDVERAASRERVRLARELHDVVAHSVSVLVIQAQAVRRRLRPDQEREVADLRALEDVAREAMTEMRRLLGVLRDGSEDEALAPQPGLADVPRLIDSLQAGDVAVRLVVSGEPRPLSPGLDLAAYRIVQEALTNAVRHSGASLVVVRVDQRPSEIDVCVEDDGTGLGSGQGNGLRGMRERADMYGGTLEVCTQDRAGTRVQAVLPVGGRR
jgi:signal transduction histidine kinase